MTSKHTNENDNEVKTKNNLRGGDPKDDNSINGWNLIEQAFSSQ